MIKAKKATIFKSGKEFTLIKSEANISMEELCDIFGRNTIKVNSHGVGIFEIEALYGNDMYFKPIENINGLAWEDITIS